MPMNPSTAFVLGAGLGTRLKALTAHCPKPLIPVGNMPLITRAFSHLHHVGVERFVVNTHWKSDCYPKTFPECSWNQCPIIFSEEQPDVLETAGGLKFAEHHLPANAPFWVYNGDILSDLPLEKALAAHLSSKNEVTLVLRSKDGPLQISMDEFTKQITDIGRRLHPNIDPSYLFTGIYIVDPAFLSRIPLETKISVVPIFIEMIRKKARIGGVVIDDGSWWDLGERSQYLSVHKHIAPMNQPHWIHPSAQIAADVSLNGNCAIGPNAQIESGVTLVDSIIWENGHVSAGSNLTRCIVTKNASAQGAYIDFDFEP